jgi:spore coat protein CotH
LYLAEVLLWLGMVSCRDGGENVDPAEFLNIEIGALPDKTVYLLGETPDFTGLAIHDIYTDSSRKENTDYEILWENPFKRGASTVTVMSREQTVAFEIFFEDELTDTGLPVVYIETERQQPVLSKEDYINAMMIIKKDGETLHENGLRIRGRGNATWDCPKKPYKFNLDGKTDLLGMGEDKDWVLLANYRDKSLIRTSIAFKLSELLDFPWTPKARFVELVLNGEYMGNYQLTEIVTRGAHRVDIPKDGYLIERDDYYLEEPVWFVTPRGYGYSFKNPDTDDLTEAQLNHIRDYMTALETLLASGNFNDPVSGYAKYLDTESFARWFLFQQILANIDANVYLTKKDNGDSKLFMGPVWDFEWSLGVGWYYGERPRPANYYVYESNAFYYDRLLRDPAFTVELKRQWRQIDVMQDILQHIDETKEMLQQSQALNYQRWDILNTLVSYGGIPLGSYEKEIACDREFFVNHMNWLSAAINGL